MLQTGLVLQWGKEVGVSLAHLPVNVDMHQKHTASTEIRVYESIYVQVVRSCTSLLNPTPHIQSP